MNSTNITILLIFIGAISAFFFFFFNYLKKQLKDEMKDTQEQFINLARQQFESEQNKAITEFETRKQAVESSVLGLKEELGKYQELVRSFEQDRDRKYGNLENELKNASQTTLKLQDTTNRLNNILGNVKLRGQWGERMAEDIITYAGLVEGVNFLKQKQLQSANTKPDFTFLLPNEHIINMDVKFPLDNYLNMVNSEDQVQKDVFRKEFIKNVKERIKEIQNRDYINPSEGTLDFVLLFIPNEQVFGIIHEKMPTLMDESLKQKVVLCSPFTLYAMLSVIRKSYENFRFEKDIKKILGLITQFSKSYEVFKKRFVDIGEKLVKLQDSYDSVHTTSFKGLDGKINKIEDYKKGKGIALDEDAQATEPLESNITHLERESLN